MQPSTGDTTVRVSRKAYKDLEKYIDYKKTKGLKISKRGLIQQFAAGLAKKVV